jgi:hypothetical protein
MKELPWDPQTLDDKFCAEDVDIVEDENVITRYHTSSRYKYYSSCYQTNVTALTTLDRYEDNIHFAAPQYHCSFFKPTQFARLDTRQPLCNHGKILAPSYQMMRRFLHTRPLWASQVLLLSMLVNLILSDEFLGTSIFPSLNDIFKHCGKVAVKNFEKSYMPIKTTWSLLMFLKANLI